MTLTTADSTSNSRICIATATDQSWTNGCIARLQAKEEAYMSGWINMIMKRHTGEKTTTEGGKETANANKETLDNLNDT